MHLTLQIGEPDMLNSASDCEIRRLHGKPIEAQRATYIYKEVGVGTLVYKGRTMLRMVIFFKRESWIMERVWVHQQNIQFNFGNVHYGSGNFA